MFVVWTHLNRMQGLGNTIHVPERGEALGAFPLAELTNPCDAAIPSIITHVEHNRGYLLLLHLQYRWSKRPLELHL